MLHGQEIYLVQDIFLDHDISMESAVHFEDKLREIFANAGWRFQRPLRGADDLVVRAGPNRYAVQIKYAKEARRSLLEGLVASSILRARAAAHSADAKPLAIIAAPFISDPLLKELGEFVSRYGEGAAWGAMDDSGLVVMHGDGLENIRGERSHVSKPSVVQRADIFSDLGQWMLKVLLSHQLPPELRVFAPLDGSRIDNPVVNARSLAMVAGVSVPSASRFVAALREERFLLERESLLRLIRVDELLDRWRGVYKRRPSEVRARWLFAPSDGAKHLDEMLQKHQQKPGERACLGLFAACAHLGFRFVRGVAPHVLLERVSSEALRPFGLRLAEPGEAADVIARQPRFPESAFRGAAQRDGVRVADVLQCWLDVADHPARGEEMAEHLFERVVRPSLLEVDR